MFRGVVDEIASAQVAEVGVLLAVQVRDEEILFAHSTEVTRHDSHVRLCLPVGVQGAATHQRLVAKRPVLLIDPQEVRHGVVGDEQVRQPSPFISAASTPSVLPALPWIPDDTDTSSKRPLPMLWNKRERAGLNVFGPQ
jgi:hypothetical protein